jgi:hypothetical protein
MAKRLNGIASPAYWYVCVGNPEHVLGPDILPCLGFAVSRHERWFVVRPVDLAETFVTQRAILPEIPLGEYGP